MNSKALLCGLCVAVSACASPQWRAPPTEADFATIKNDMQAQDVLARLGPPTYTFSIPRQAATVWNYRLVGGDCIVFQIVVTQDGRVRESSNIWDPRCDGPNRRSLR